MKKTLLTLGAVAAMSFAFVACGDDTKDCVCKAYMNIADEGEEPDWYPAEGVPFEKNDWDGDCDEITSEDLVGSDVTEQYGKIDCSEK